MATKLQIYNKALQLCGEPKLASTSEAAEARYDLDVAWDTCVIDLFGAGGWTFATVTTALSDTGSPISGYAYRFDLPTDLVRIISASTTARFSDEADYRLEGASGNDAIYAQVDTLWVKYISSYLSADAQISYWSAPFCETLGFRLAAEIGMKIATSREKRAELWGLYERRLAENLAREDGNQARQLRLPAAGMALMPLQQQPQVQQRGEA